MAGVTFDGAAFELPAQKREAIVAEFADSGKKWVDDYPELLTACVQRWQLKLTGMASTGLLINVIFYAESDTGEPVVLKIGHPHPEQKTEMIAMRAYQGRYAANILGWDGESGALLMERVIPGKKLRDVSNDIERSRIRINLINDLPLAVSDTPGLPSFDEWIHRAFRKFRRSSKQLSDEATQEFMSYIELAETLFAKLLHKHPETYLLHGDLHHENILLDEERGWLAIDPKGVVGPKVMECGRYLHNFIEDEITEIEDIEDASDLQIRQVLEERFAIFTDMLDFDKIDIIAATFFDLVLSTSWSINSNQQVDFKRLRVLYSLIRK